MIRFIYFSLEVVCGSHPSINFPDLVYTIEVPDPQFTIKTKFYITKIPATKHPEF